MLLSNILNYSILLVYSIPIALSLIDNRFIVVALGVIFINTLNQILKYSLGTRHSIFERPVEACDCSLIINGGPCGKRPGFPSGHVATVAGFCVLLVAKFNLGWIWLPFLFAYTGAMAWARVTQRCHTEFQVAAGILSGSIFAILWLYLFPMYK